MTRQRNHLLMMGACTVGHAVFHLIMCYTTARFYTGISRVARCVHCWLLRAVTQQITCCTCLHCQLLLYCLLSREGHLRSSLVRLVFCLNRSNWLRSTLRWPQASELSFHLVLLSRCHGFLKVHMTWKIFSAYLKGLSKYRRIAFFFP